MGRAEFYWGWLSSLPVEYSKGWEQRDKFSSLLSSLREGHRLWSIAQSCVSTCGFSCSARFRAHLVPDLGWILITAAVV